jgi:tripartite-type tricarboxylate transporter receptor subunit TctC
LNREIARVLNAPEVTAKLMSVGLEPVANAPEEFGAILKADLAKWGKLIRDAGIRAN